MHPSGWWVCAQLTKEGANGAGQFLEIVSGYWVSKGGGRVADVIY